MTPEPVAAAADGLAVPPSCGGAALSPHAARLKASRAKAEKTAVLLIVVMIAAPV